ncbi:MAG: DUF559 domain-containing protein [Anaerolineales bacterium]
MEDYVSRETKDGLIESARRMRREPTRAENLLWGKLRKKQLSGYRFRRQHIIQTFIVDFYCPQARLVVEVDGSIHELQKEYDKERTRALKELGYQELRLLNNEVERDLDGVLKQIHGRCVELTPSPSLPLSRGRVPPKAVGRGS